MESSRIFRGRYRLFIQVSIMTSIITPCRITGKQFQNLLNSGDETLRCDINCSASLRTPLCGSDGRTYDSLCDIERANCEGHPVRLKQPGQCPESKRCLMERLHAQEMAQKPAAGIFIPECHSDGSFSTVQCHAGTGYCWCVNKHGRPIPGSSTRFERPNCAHYSNVNSLKRTARGRRPRRSCGILDRDAFNKNLVQVFGSEFKRVQESNNLSSTSPLELRIITWKFNQLDANDNQVLNKSELRDLRRMVKKIIRPRPCARTFTQYCDLDLNKNITHAEWAVCLGVTLNKDETTQVSALKKTTSGNKAIKTMLPSTTTMPASTSTISEAEFIPQFTRSPKGSRMPSSWKSQFNDFNRAQGGIDFLQEVIPTNKSEKKKMAHKRRPTCGSERSKALTKQRKDPSAWTYVPDCDNSGNYAKVQCHSATRFCWCVNPENGKPISQTSKFNAQPNCNLVSFRPLRGADGRTLTQK